MTRHKFILTSILLLVILLLLLLQFSPIQRNLIHKVQYDETKLHHLLLAVDLYECKYGVLPTEAEFKNVLLSNEMVTNERTFYSDDTDILIRYFCNGNHFVLVSPGKNKKYDIPEGYKNIKEFQGKTDDIVRFSE